jgi:hypothetical protein
MMNQFIRLLTAIHREEGPLGIQIGRKFGGFRGIGDYADIRRIWSKTHKILPNRVKFNQR